MSTIREIMQAEANDLRARAAAIEKKMEDVEPELKDVLEKEAAKVVVFLRTIGAHIFAHAPIPAAAGPAPTPADSSPAQ